MAGVGGFTSACGVAPGTAFVSTDASADDLADSIFLWIANTMRQSGGNHLEIQQDENLAVLYRVGRELRDAHNDVPIERSILNKWFELRRQHS